MKHEIEVQAKLVKETLKYRSVVEWKDTISNSML